MKKWTKARDEDEAVATEEEWRRRDNDDGAI